LVEVMVTLVIIGLLTTFVVINVLPAQDKALTQKAKGDIRILEQAMEMYRLDMFDYPEQSAGLEALKHLPSGADEARYRKGGYIKLLPNDPWGRPYYWPHVICGDTLYTAAQVGIGETSGIINRAVECSGARRAH